MISPDHYLPSRTLHRRMNLPTLTSLAQDSVVFDNAFCASPLCAPARAALYTGRYTYITANGERAHDGHETTLRPDDTIFQEYLRASGYVTKHAGKGHVGTAKFIDAFDENSAGWDRWSPPISSDENYRAHLRALGVRPQKYSREIRGLQQDRKTAANSAFTRTTANWPRRWRFCRRSKRRIRKSNAKSIHCRNGCRRNLEEHRSGFSVRGQREFGTQELRNPNGNFLSS